MPSKEERRAALLEVFQDSKGCTRCPHLAATRKTVVFGAGNADADLMFIGEAPGQTEDERGLPFVGAAGRFLDELLAGIGLRREDVFIQNCLMCRPPQNRNPEPQEIDSCQSWLWRKLELVQPTVVATLGNFSTKLLRGDMTGITRLHGRPEVREIGPRAVRLLPLFHPAAALYKDQMKDVLRADFQVIPRLLEMGPPPQPGEPEPELETAAVPSAQLGLF